MKICKYSFEISKICILSLNTGLSFINAFAIISLIFIQIIDTIKNNSDVDHRLYERKLKKNLLKDVTTNHFIDFEIPIFLKDISSFFNNIDIMHNAEFDILIGLIDDLFVSKREGATYDIKSAHLIVEEIELSEEDELRYLKKLDNGFIKKVNFLENHVKIFNDKLNIVRQDFYVNNVRNGDSIYIYGILDANKEGMHYDLPNVKFNEPFLNIDNVKFENEITNDISAFKNFKSKSIQFLT